jgi:phage-related protein
MKKTLIVLAAVIISLLLVSTATAIPQKYSEPAMNIIENIEQKNFLSERMEKRIDSEDFFRTTGIIDWIIQLLQFILNFIRDLIQFVLELFQIINLINMIISAINQLIDVIAQFIQAIIDLFTPNLQNAISV